MNQLFKFIFLFFSLFILIFAIPSFADSTFIFGTRPLGMGGAYTAIAENYYAQYWNPAGLALNKGGFDFQLPFGAGAMFTGNLLESVNNIGNLATKFSAIDTLQKTGASAPDISQLSAVVTAMKNLKDIGSNSSGFITTAGGGMGIRIGKISVSANNYMYVGVKPYTEFNELWLGSATISGSSANRLFSHALSDTYEGIKIDTSNVNFTSLTNTALSEEKAALVTQLNDWLKQDLVKAGVEIPAGLTSDQIANVLLNVADTNGVTEADIQKSINTIVENKELISTLINASSSGSNPFANNQSNITLKGINITELSVGYGRQVYKDMYVGGNVKLMTGTVGYYRQLVFDKKVEMKDTLSDFTKFSKQSSQVGIDVGFIMDKRETPLKGKFGIMAKNINKPVFDIPEEAVKYNEQKITLNPEIRAGAAFYPAKFWSISSDIDLTDNVTLIPGYISKTFSIGTEINMINKSWINIPLRAGLIKNISYQNNEYSYTLGLGLNLAHFVIDISGQMGAQSVNIDQGASLPKTISGQFSLSLNF